jgi:transposase
LRLDYQQVFPIHRLSSAPFIVSIDGEYRRERDGRQTEVRGRVEAYLLWEGEFEYFDHTGIVQFPAATCAGCALRERCTTSTSGRSVRIHPDEALLQELRERQQTPQGRAKLRERVAVEHALAHIGSWQGRRARYRGVRKNVFDLRRYAVVHNLHVWARLTAPQQQAA